MRIILIGQAAFAERTSEKLIGQGDEVAAVYCPLDPPGSKLNPAKQKALELGISVRQHRSLKTGDVSGLTDRKITGEELRLFSHGSEKIWIFLVCQA